jgi:hypothetical protein
MLHAELDRLIYNRAGEEVVEMVERKELFAGCGLADIICVSSSLLNQQKS